MGEGAGASGLGADLEGAIFATLQSLHGASATTHRAFVIEVSHAVIGEGLGGDGFVAGGASQESPCGGDRGFGAFEEEIPVQEGIVVSENRPAFRLGHDRRMGDIHGHR